MTSGRRGRRPLRICGIFIVLNNIRMCGGNRYDIGPPRTSVPTIKKDNRRMRIDNRYDLGRPMVAPTGKMGIFVSETDRSSFCNRGDLGRSKPIPTSFIYSLFSFIFYLFSSIFPLSTFNFQLSIFLPSHPCENDRGIVGLGV